MKMEKERKLYRHKKDWGESSIIKDIFKTFCCWGDEFCCI